MPEGRSVPSPRQEGFRLLGLQFGVAGLGFRGVQFSGSSPFPEFRVLDLGFKRGVWGHSAIPLEDSELQRQDDFARTSSYDLSEAQLQNPENHVLFRSLTLQQIA